MGRPRGRIRFGSGCFWCLLAVSISPGGHTVAFADDPSSAGFGGAAAGRGVVVVETGNTSGPPGSSVSIGATLHTGGQAVAGLRIDIEFSPLTPVAAGATSAPDCTVNLSINKDLSSFAFLSNTAIRAVVAGSNLNLIPDGALLFTCTVAIDVTAPPGEYPVGCSNTLASDPTASPVESACTPGRVTVVSPSTLVDHYKCYEGSDLQNPELTKRIVQTSDPLREEPLAVQKLSLICSPVDKNGEGIQNRDQHLACYQVKSENMEPAPRVLVSTQFQQTNFALRKPSLLCVPATKTLLP